MTARELNVWLRGLHAVPEPSVDRVIVGDPETVVRGIGVLWMPTWQALRAAVAQGCNVVVAHEPTFFSHHDLDGFEAGFSELPPRARESLESTREAKRRWIEEQGLVVIRCHDVLDAMPGGVVDCLATGLGFSRADYVAEWQRYRVVRIQPAVAAGELARRLATAFGTIRQTGVAFYGDAERVVHSLGLGTGYGCEPWRFIELGAEMGITIDDRIKTWTEGEWADDSGFPLVVINHGTSEEWGVRWLAELLRERFSADRVDGSGDGLIPVRLIPQGCGYRWVAP